MGKVFLETQYSRNLGGADFQFSIIRETIEDMTDAAMTELFSGKGILRVAKNTDRREKSFYFKTEGQADE